MKVTKLVCIMLEKAIPVPCSLWDVVHHGGALRLIAFDEEAPDVPGEAVQVERRREQEGKDGGA